MSRKSLDSQAAPLLPPTHTEVGDGLTSTVSFVMLGSEAANTLPEAVDPTYYSIHDGTLYAPLAWSCPLPIKMLLCLICIPFIGMSFAVFGISEKRHRGQFAALHNPSDWVLFLFCGILLQACIGFVSYNITVPQDTVDFQSDWIGSFVFSGAVVTYFFMISIYYYSHQDHGTGKVSKARKVEKTVLKASGLLTELRAETEFPSGLIIGIAGGVALLEVMVIRLCFDKLDGGCNGNISYYSIKTDLYFWLSTTFWFCLLSCANGMSMYGALIYWQLMKQVEGFTYIQKMQRSKRRRAMLTTLTDFSKDVAVWAEMYHQLIHSIRNRPIIQATFNPTAAATIFMFIGCVSFIVIRNVYADGGIAEFTIGCSTVAVYCLFLVGFFLYVTVRLHRAVEHQTCTISQAQNEMQRRLDDGRDEMERNEYLKTQSNLRVIQALDVYLHVADASPRVLGMSLESLRWTVLLVGLIAINYFFFVLYIAKCYRKDNEEASNVPSTISP